MTFKTFLNQSKHPSRQASLARGLLASLMLCLSLGAFAQNYYTGPNSPIHTFGQKFAQAAQVVDSQSRMVFYRTRQSSSVPGAASVYVNGAYHASIIPGGYSQLCMPPGSVELGLKSVEVGTNVKDNVVQGKTYSFSFVYWDSYAKDYKVGPATNFMDVKIDGVVATTTANRSAGQITITYTATRTGSVRLSLESWNPADGGDYFLDDFKFGEVAPANTLGLTGPTENPDGSLTYTSGALDALGSNDTITVGNTSLQATLAAGGLINGGAGIDNLKLKTGTTLNLEALTANQTVKPIEQIEMITMQGGTSKLTMSANDVLSLGGSNASTMSPYTFSSTTQTASGGVQPTGSTVSTGKVQFVVNGQTGDTLNLDVLANDGVTSSNGASTGQLGNTGLAGTWAYKGTVSIAANVAADGIAHTYKVYDHSTTGAQVLVDVDVTVNTITPITITAISTDSGVSATDFITNDQTLTYTGGLPAAFNSATERVLVEIVDSSNQVVSTGFATPSGTTWTWNNQADTELAGNYTIRSTIVGLTNTTAVAAYGAGGVATQPMTIDLTTPTVAISRTDGLSTTVGGTGTEVTFTLSEASADFTNGDIETTGGSLSTLVQSSTNPLVYTATSVADQRCTGQRRYAEPEQPAGCRRRPDTADRHRHCATRRPVVHLPSGRHPASHDRPAAPAARDDVVKPKAWIPGQARDDMNQAVMT
jgi:hypothetical protein